MFIHPQHLTHLWVLALAGVVGFVGYEVAAQVRLHAGKRLASAAMTADGNHARIDGFVSLGVVASAIVVALGAQIADPIIGLTITLVILKITWDSWNTVRKATIDLEHVGDEHDDHEHAADAYTPTSNLLVYRSPGLSFGLYLWDAVEWHADRPRFSCFRTMPISRRRSAAASG